MFKQVYIGVRAAIYQYIHVIQYVQNHLCLIIYYIYVLAVSNGIFIFERPPKIAVVCSPAYHQMGRSALDRKSSVRVYCMALNNPIKGPADYVSFCSQKRSEKKYYFISCIHIYIHIICDYNNLYSTPQRFIHGGKNYLYIIRFTCIIIIITLYVF